MERQDHAFTFDAVALHVDTLLAGLDRLAQRGWAVGRHRVEILATPQRRALGERLAAQFDARLGELDHPYYSGGLRYRIWVCGPDGTDLPLGDGGTFDWLHALAANRRAVFVGSGLGTQLIALRFAPPA